MHTLIIKDLSASIGLDSKAMGAVRGGNGGDQANGVAQTNAQSMAAAANVGNDLAVHGPLTIQSDNTFKQDADNDSDAFNIKKVHVGYYYPYYKKAW
jgi:hypothetical protein